MEKYISPLRVSDSNCGRAFQENSLMEVKLEKEGTGKIMEIDLTLEKSPEKNKPSTYVTDNKNKFKKLKLRKNRGEKRKFPDKTDPKKIKRKKKEEKSGAQVENAEVLPVTLQSKFILKKEGTIVVENSNLENTEKTNQKSSRKSKAIVNKCKYTLDVLLKLNSDVLESMDKSLRIIKSQGLLSNKYISIDVLMDLISLALEKREEGFEESSFSLIVSKCLNVACVAPQRLKVNQSSDCGSVMPNNKSLLEEPSLTTAASKEELIEKETSTIQNLEETKQIESDVFEIVQEKSGRNFCITNYFKKLKRNVEGRDKNERFSCFSTKTDMFLAPKLGGELTGERRRQFEKEFSSQQCEGNYLLEHSSKGGIKKFINEGQESTKKPLHLMEGGVAIAGKAEAQKRVSLIRVDKPKVEGLCRTKAKLFQFHDNRRPPYWGTWRRKSETVGPRKPFGRDRVFNYEIDSDDEWEEEEEPGESLHGSDDEKEPEEDYEVDNDFFVPHGYLSDDENPEKENLSPKTKLDLLEEQFTSEMKQKARKMTPIVFGTFWVHNGQPYEGNLYQDLQIEKLQYVPWTVTPIEIEEEKDKNNGNPPEEPATQVKKPKQKIFPNEEIPNLIKMIHGSPQNSDHLARKFLLYWETEKISNRNHPGLTKICVQKKIKELAAWQASHEKGKMCWQVPKETREEFGARMENKTPEKKPRKCFIWKFVRKAEKNPSGDGSFPSASPPPPTSGVEPEVVIFET